MHRFLTANLLPVLAVLVFAQSGNLIAQTGTSESHARAGNGIISVQVERSTGQYRIESADGTPLLFRGEKGVTGFVNIHYKNDTYTNNLLHRSAPPEGARALRGIEVEELSDRVRVTAVLRHAGDSLRFAQELIPALDGDYAYINSVITLTNLSGRSVRAGVLTMFDIMIGARDTVDLRADQETVTRERAWQGASVPSEYRASAEGSPYVIRGRLSGGTADRPDVFTAGNWQFNGYLGTAVWDYTPSGLPIIDDAVLLQWNARDISGGDAMRVRSDYGFVTFSDLALTCALPALIPAPDSTSYAPYPIPASAVVTNTGSLPVSGIDVRITLPAELHLAFGETAVKTITGPLNPGAQARLEWMLLADTVDSPNPVVVDFSIVTPAELAEQCRASAVIPPVRAPALSLFCGDTIRLAIAEEGAAYEPDPFTISTYISNSGNMPLTNLTAEIQLPPGVVLASGNARKPVVPGTLAPGEGTVVDWSVRGILQPARTVAPYSVIVTATEAASSCGNAVILPPFSQEPCIEPGVSTAGQEFWLTFLPDLVGAAQENLRIYISAPQQATVTLWRSDINAQQTVQIPAGGMRMVEMDRALNLITPEYTTRKGVRIRSDSPVHVFAGNFRDRHTDAFTVLPVHALGTRYVTAGYNFPDVHEHFSVLAVEDNTTVTITPAAFTSTGKPNGQPITVTLDAGDIYYIKAYIAGVGGSLTGSRIESDRPVAVYSGAESGWVPEQGGDPSGFLNPLAEQMIPHRYLGTEYVGVPFRSRFGGDTYRIVATEDQTTVTVGSGTTFILPQAGSWKEDLLHDPSMITADKPVMVAQYAHSALWDHPDSEYGDGSMLLLVPTDRYMSCHYFPAGTLVADVDIVANQAVQVNAASWLQVDDTPRLASPVFTVEFWLRANSDGTVVSRRAGADEIWRLDYEFMRGRLAFVTEKPGEQSYNPTPDNSVFQGIWNHVALVVDGPAGRAEIYLNGQREIVASFPATRFEGEGGLAFGGVHDDASKAEFWGDFDECRIWALPRTERQIVENMNRRILRHARGGMTGYWAFCGNLHDETLFGHDLEARGSAPLRETFNLPATLSCSDQLDSNFVNLVVPRGGEQAVTVNFQPLQPSAFTAVPGSGGAYAYARLWLPTGINRIETSDARGAGASNYGFAYHDAYTSFTGFRVSGSTQSVATPAVPTGLVLHAPAPQPLRESARVRFDLPSAGHADLRLTDLLGRELRPLVSGRLEAGRHERVLQVDGLRAGTYILHLRTAGAHVFRRIVIVP